jgi:hypothetical protein
MKRTAVLLLISVVLFVLLISGCSRASNSSLSTTPTSPASSPTATLPPDQEPIEVVSATGPWPSWYEDGKPVYNPGGPIVEITLRNVSEESIIFLEASLDANRPDRPFEFTFDVTISNPLLTGESISARQSLIGGGFGDLPLPLTINGKLQSNVAFVYTKEVFITQPPE